MTNLIIDRYVELRALLQLHDELFNIGKPKITDAEYDALYQEGLMIERQHPGITETYVGLDTIIPHDTVMPAKEVKHTVPMLSLDKCYFTEDLLTFERKLLAVLPSKLEAKLNYVVDFKHDGMAIEGLYRNGQFVRLATRGSGAIGEQITYAYDRISGMPKTIALTGDVYIRGEAVMGYRTLQVINLTRSTDEQYSNARNATAGLLRALSEPTYVQPIQFTAYSIHGDTIPDLTVEQQYKLLVDNGFQLFNGWVVYSTMAEIIADIEHWRTAGAEMDTPTDGIVIKINDPIIQRSLGETTKYPKWAIAFKWANVTAKTRLRKVEWSMGRTGVLTPVGILDPVEINNVVVSRVNLYNPDEIRRLGLGFGHEVLIARAGSVIPKVIANLYPANAATKFISIPRSCPYCESTLITDGGLLYCPDKVNCAEQNIARLTWFLSPNGLDIDGVSTETVRLLYTSGTVKDYVDIFKIAKGEITIPKLYNEHWLVQEFVSKLRGLRSITYHGLIAGLGISGVGRQTALTIARRYPTIDDLLNTTVEALEELPGIGTGTAVTIMVTLADFRMRDILAGITSRIRVDNESGVLCGQRWCFTGTFETIDRAQTTALLRSLGANVTNTVSKNTKALVAGNNPGAKLGHALALGVPVYTETILKDYLDSITK